MEPATPLRWSSGDGSARASCTPPTHCLQCTIDRLPSNVSAPKIQSLYKEPLLPNLLPRPNPQSLISRNHHPHPPPNPKSPHSLILLRLPHYKPLASSPTPPTLSHTRNAERQEESNSYNPHQQHLLSLVSPNPERTHCGPIPHTKVLRQRVERDIAPRALGVVVGTGELSAGGVEAAAGCD